MLLNILTALLVVVVVLFHFPAICCCICAPEEYPRFFSPPFLPSLQEFQLLTPHHLLTFFYSTLRRARPDLVPYEKARCLFPLILAPYLTSSRALDGQSRLLDSWVWKANFLSLDLSGYSPVQRRGRRGGKSKGRKRRRRRRRRCKGKKRKKRKEGKEEEEEERGGAEEEEENEGAKEEREANHFGAKKRMRFIDQHRPNGPALPNLSI